MPLYDYKCVGCNHPFESYEAAEAKDKVKCPKCGELAGSRLLSLYGGYHIKGDNGASQRPRSAGSFKKGKK